jgi:putative DNA primase/helicase
MSVSKVKVFAEAVARGVAGPIDIKETVRCAGDASQGHVDGKNVFGYPQMVEVFGEKVMKTCAEWLGYNDTDGAGKKKRKKTRHLGFENEEGLPLLIAGHMTDLGNAIRLVDRHQENIRYVHEFKCWLVWNGIYWQRDTDGGITRLAIETVEAMFEASSQITNEEFRTKFRIFASQTQARQKIVAMIELAKADERIVLSPDAMDADPMLLGVLNGTIELATQTFREGRREDYITQRCNVAYDPEARCPEWEKSVLKVAGGNQELVKYKRRYFGVCLTGIPFEILFIAHGGGQNGKTTELETIHETLGGYAIALDASVLLSAGKGQSSGAASPDIVALKGKRFLSINETSENDHLNEARVKYLACTDTMKGRALYENTINFKPTHKGTLRTNHKPKIRGTDLGIWRRIHYIPYTVTISNDEKNEHYREEKLIPELPGILNWMLEGLRDYLTDGKLRPPEVVCKAKEEYQKEMDSIGQWIEISCEHTPDYNAVLSLGTLHLSYEKWAKDEVGWVGSRQKLADKLREHGFVDFVSHGVSKFKGIRLKDDPF